MIAYPPYVHPYLPVSALRRTDAMAPVRFVAATSRFARAGVDTVGQRGSASVSRALGQPYLCGQVLPAVPPTDESPDGVQNERAVEPGGDSLKRTSAGEAPGRADYQE